MSWLLKRLRLPILYHVISPRLAIRWIVRGCNPKMAASSFAVWNSRSASLLAALLLWLNSCIVNI